MKHARTLLAAIAVALLFLAPARAQQSVTYTLEAVAGSPSTVNCWGMTQGPLLEENQIAVEYRAPISPYGLNTRAVKVSWSFAATCPTWGVENMNANTPFAAWSQSYGSAFQLSVKGTRRMPMRAPLSLTNVGFTYAVGGGVLSSYDGTEDYSGTSGRFGSGSACQVSGSNLTTDAYACARVAYGHPNDPSRVRIDLVTAYHLWRWFFISTQQPELGYQIGSGHAWDASCALTMSRPVVTITYFDHVPATP